MTNMPFDGTNGWQSWQNFYKEIYLGKGEQKMIVTPESSHFNINYYDLVFVKEAQEIPGKIEVSRCQIFDFKRISLRSKNKWPHI